MHRRASSSSRIFRPAISDLHEAEILARKSTGIIPASLMGHGVPAALGAHFAAFLQSDAAPDPQLVVDAYVALADMPAGKRPTRTVVGITWGLDAMNATKQPIQDRVLNEMQLEGVLGGVSA